MGFECNLVSRSKKISRLVLVAVYTLGTSGVLGLVQSDVAQAAPGDNYPGNVSSNIALWFKANEGTSTTVSGATVSSWQDQSGNGRDLTSNFTPAFNPNSINFGSAVEYLGRDRHVLSPVNVAVQNSTMYIVGRTGGSVFADAWTTNTRSDSLLNDVVLYRTSAGNAVGYFDDPGSTTYLTPLTWATGEVSLFRVELSDAVNYDATFTKLGGASSTMTSVNPNQNNPFNGYSVLGNFESDNFAAPFGDISETIVYSTASQPSIDKQKIESYLALKYGITLDQSSPLSYIASDGSTLMWDASANGEYNDNIVGIGRDDASGLDQRVSRSVHPGDIITVALDNNFTAANADPARTTTHATNNQYFVIAHNGAATTTQTTELNRPAYRNRVAREWRVDSTNFSQNVNFRFTGFNDDYFLVSDADGDFSTGSVEVGQLSASGDIANVNLADGMYFTLMTKGADVEFVNASAADMENVGSNLPQLYVSGTLDVDTDIDVVLGAGGTASPSIDYTFGGAAALPQTVTVTIPAGSYNNDTIALSSLNVSGGGLVNFTIVDDGDTETLETIDMTLSNPQGNLFIANVIGGATISNHVYSIVDDESPSVTLNQASTQADPTNVDSAEFTVVFSEAVDPATFTSVDIVLTGTSGTVTSGPTTTDNITWSFIVSGMTDGDTVIASIPDSSVQTPLLANFQQSYSTDNAVTYDVTPPPTPIAAPDLIASSDTGSSNTDDLTTDTTPTFDVQCSAAGNTITLYTNNPAPNTVMGTHVCLGTGTETVTANTQPEGVHTVTYTETDPAGNVSAPSPGLVITIQLTPPSGIDDDGDGILSSVESQAINDGDGNGDGIQDSQQDYVTSIVNALTNRPVTLAVNTASSCRLEQGYEVVAAPKLDAYSYPIGMFDFEMTCAIPGDSVTVTIYLDSTYSTNAWDWRKYNATKKSITSMAENVVIGNAMVGTTRVTTATFTLKDGGALDEDGAVNGKIVDPSGPGVLGTLTDTGAPAYMPILFGLFVILGGLMMSPAALLFPAKEREQ